MSALNQLFADHSRDFENFKYVYPVISRRAEGLSIGINLNPEYYCNFACVYCCVVERAQGMKSVRVDVPQLLFELECILERVQNQSFWTHPKFAQTPENWRILKDITFAGNGEPTSSPDFVEAVEKVRVLRDEQCARVKLILLTNATLLENKRVCGVLSHFSGDNGEVWAKLDAGTQSYFELVNRSHTRLEKIVSQIIHLGQKQALVIQSMFCKQEFYEFDWNEYDAWLNQIEYLISNQVQLKRVQIYTIARETTLPEWVPLKRSLMLEMKSQFEQRFPTTTLQCVLPTE